MRVTLSAAVTADGFLDDNSPRRLIISTPEDWAEVYRLRAAHDAILVGAETLRYSCATKRFAPAAGSGDCRPTSPK